jgi:hypothetical protein
MSLFAGWKWARNSFDNVRGVGELQAADETRLGLFETGGDYEFK